MRRDVELQLGALASNLRRDTAEVELTGGRRLTDANLLFRARDRPLPRDGIRILGDAVRNGAIALSLNGRGQSNPRHR